MNRQLRKSKTLYPIATVTIVMQIEVVIQAIASQINVIVISINYIKLFSLHVA